jgi:cold shock CspA family protein
MSWEEPSGRITGIVKLWKPEGYGFVSRPGDSDVFIHASEWCSPSPPVVGAQVSYEVIELGGRARAKTVTPA